jgi:hypothetical protein
MSKRSDQDLLSFATTLRRHSLYKKHVILNRSAAEVKNLVVP